MKYKLILLFLAICISFCSCGKLTGDTSDINNESSGLNAAEKEENDIISTYNEDNDVVSEPPLAVSIYTFTEDFPSLCGKTLLIELIESSDGSYDSEDKFNGNFEFRITESDITSNYEKNYNDIISCKMHFEFDDKFDLNVTDYNDDGNPDFAINQWGSLSGGTNCYLFSVTQESKVTDLRVDAYQEQQASLWLPKMYRTYYSPVFKKEGDNMFSVEYYTFGGVNEEEIPLIPSEIMDKWFSDEKHSNYTFSEFTLKNIYLWTNDSITLIEQQILEPNGEVWFP